MLEIWDFGLGISDLVDAAALSFYFAVGMGWWPCGCNRYCFCALCDGSSSPGSVACEFEIELSGFAKPEDTCGDCGDLNGTYLLTPDDQLPCAWLLRFESPICGVQTFSLNYNGDLTLNLLTDPGVLHYRFARYSVADDCASWTEFTLPMAAVSTLATCETGWNGQEFVDPPTCVMRSLGAGS